MKTAKDCAEIFGAMGVMRDMPLQKFIHDARVCQHSGDGNSEARLRIAEVIAGYRRKPETQLALAGE
jgi:alkylation response protein AidB-like acyl-CoA dehydrogenase